MAMNHLGAAEGKKRSFLCSHNSGQHFWRFNCAEPCKATEHWVNHSEWNGRPADVDSVDAKAACMSNEDPDINLKELFGILMFTFSTRIKS